MQPSAAMPGAWPSSEVNVQESVLSSSHAGPGD